MARPSNTRERRRQIASALRRVMARSGWDGASVAEVAREAGLAPGLVHYHFSSKLDILLELLGTIVSEHAARVAASLEAAGPDPGARLDAFIDAHLATGRQADPDALACWVSITAEALREPRVARAFEAGVSGLLATLGSLVSDGVRAGVFGRVDAAGAAAAIFSTIQGYYVLAATARALIPRGSAAPAARRMAHGLLAPAAGRPGRRRRKS